MTRLQKILANAGLGSRRSIEQWIRDGRISVAGRVARLGDRAGPADQVCLDGRPLQLNPGAHSARDLLLYHKPLGEVSTRSDPQGRPTVFERLPSPASGRWVNVGRLDVNTSGLLLFTTEGDLAHALMHPSTQIEREYLVRVRGNPPAQVLQRLLDGVALDDGPARFDRLQPHGRESGHPIFRVVLHGGRNREIRRLWLAVGFDVSRLRRIRYGPIEHPDDLAPGRWRLATPKLRDELWSFVRKSAGMLLARESGKAQLKGVSDEGRGPDR
jgi:23S rRNA pseudouridine2605 synthase